MRPNHRSLVAVETLGPQARLIKLGVTLDHASAGEVTQLIHGQLALARTGNCTIAHLVIDVTDVEVFVPGAVHALLPVRDQARVQQIDVYISGCADRAHRLADDTRAALTEFDPFVTANTLDQA